ncbi:MAG TPA: hypothetical protein VJ600_01165 [Holophagaceae bacterium]|nr:hypothetical protein [Holophagaceae bacterium]
MRAAALLLPALIAPAIQAQITLNVTDAFKSKKDGWELRLRNGDAEGVRREAESMLSVEGVNVSPTSYSDIHTLVALRSLAARACVEQGAWEDAVAHLQRASSQAGENLVATEATFTKLRAGNEADLKRWKDELATQEPRLQQLEQAPGLTPEQLKLQQQLRAFVAEHKASIADSERKVKDMDDTLAALRQEKTEFEKSLADWQGFVAREKADIDAAGGATAYVAAKVGQVKADDARPVPERLAYANRLRRLDPANKDVHRLVNALLGLPEPPEDEPKPATKHRRKRRK